MFKVEVIGNLGADAEIKDANGAKFVSFRIADTQKFKDQAGNEQTETNWIDCTMSNTESKVIQYLKAGVKVFVRGNASLRVYSSQKDRCMKAGLKVFVLEVELCGGSSDDVPRQVIDPETAAIYDTTKYYWCNCPTKGMKKEDRKELTDVRGGRFLMNNQGFVARIPENDEAPQEENESQSEQ